MMQEHIRPHRACKVERLSDLAARAAARHLEILAPRTYEKAPGGMSPLYLVSMFSRVPIALQAKILHQAIQLSSETESDAMSPYPFEILVDPRWQVVYLLGSSRAPDASALWPTYRAPRPVLSNACIRPLLRCRNLCALDLGDVHRLSAELVTQLVRQQRPGSLRRLGLLDCGSLKVDTLLSDLVCASHTNLTSLSIRNAPLLTNRGIMHLVKGCRGMERLDILACPNVTVIPLTSWPRLRDVDVSGTPISDSSVHADVGHNGHHLTQRMPTRPLRRLCAGWTEVTSAFVIRLVCPYDASTSGGNVVARSANANNHAHTAAASELHVPTLLDESVNLAPLEELTVENTSVDGDALQSILACRTVVRVSLNASRHAWGDVQFLTRSSGTTLTHLNVHGIAGIWLYDLARNCQVLERFNMTKCAHVRVANDIDSRQNDIEATSPDSVSSDGMVLGFPNLCAINALGCSFDTTHANLHNATNLAHVLIRCPKLAHVELGRVGERCYRDAITLLANDDQFCRRVKRLTLVCASVQAKTLTRFLETAPLLEYFDVRGCTDVHDRHYFWWQDHYPRTIIRIPRGMIRDGPGMHHRDQGQLMLAGLFAGRLPHPV
eukprot:m.67292 g.67292  ORF g.67292 m.67292 type:complete len:608 (+) comp8424_c0_seq3:199-2022(+)